jgi:peptidoglycan/LPS O-acetylase OafA/YrhL
LWRRIAFAGWKYILIKKLGGEMENSNLDLLRSVGVICVVAFHLLLSFKKTDLELFYSIGYFGVLLFFVHTSLALMFSLERQEARSPGVNIFTPFYVRRIFRILPLSVLVVIAVALFGWPVAGVHLGKFYGVHLGAAGLVSNLLLFQNLTHTASITFPLWSLPYEMQMYLIFPVLYLLVRAMRSARLVACFWFGSALAAYIAFKFFHSPYPSFVTLAPCFLAGIVTYKTWRSNPAKARFIGWPMMAVLAVYLFFYLSWRQSTAHHSLAWYLAVGLPLVPLFIAGISDRMPGKWSTAKLPFWGWPFMLILTTYFYARRPAPASGWIWCLVLGLSLPYFSEMGHRWLRKTCKIIARYSYGIYLVHVICIWFAFVELANLPFAVRCLVCAAAIGAIPVILYHSVEAPMISLGRRIADRMPIRAEKVPQWVPAASVNSGDADFPMNL